MAVSAWTRNLKTDDQKDRFLKHLKSSHRVLERMQEILDEEILALEAAEISHKIYDAPNWDYRQAHTNGFKQAMKAVSKLITLDQEDINGRRPRQT